MSARVETPAFYEERRRLLEAENQQLRDALAVAVDVAIWMSGSGSFGPDGEAAAGWQKQRTRLYEAMDVLTGTPSAAQTLEEPQTTRGTGSS